MAMAFWKNNKKGTKENAGIPFPMESNVLKIHRANPESNSRRLREAIALVLFDIKSRYTGETYDVEAFRNADNERLEKALLMAFDPFSNEMIKDSVAIQTDPAGLREYYKEPVMCLLRIKDSIDTWEKRTGANGYFDFIETYMGRHVDGSEMDFWNIR